MVPELRDYQLAAVEHIQAHPRSALFLDMGLGKTATVLSSLRPSDLPALVIAPKRVAETVWTDETRLWRPDLSLVVAAGGPVKRGQALRDPDADLVSLGRDNLVQAFPELVKIQKGPRPFKTLILDESSSFKNFGAKRTKVALKLSTLVDRVIELTGTPNPKGYLDLWPQMKILDGGERLGKTLGGYRERYFTPQWPLPSGVIPGWDLKPGADRRILELVSDICLSMGTDGRIDLPPLTYNTVHIPLPAKVRSVYNDMEKDFLADPYGDRSEVLTAANAAVMTSKLRQITAGAMYVDDAQYRDDDTLVHLHDEKLKAAQEIIEGTGSPVLVFYQFKFERDALMRLPGAVGIDERNAIKRWNAGEVPVLVAHPQSAGHGLNLQHGGHTIVWTTPTWSLEEWQQGNKRLARSGQKHPVVVHTLVSPGTIDEAVLARIQENKSVQQALLDYLESPF